jgi:hypothetical protein
MPRLPRLDAPGILHHVMIRGIERGKIFKDDKDRDNLIERLNINSDCQFRFAPLPAGYAERSV